MNRLTKTDSRRGRGVPRTHPEGAATGGQAAATHRQSGAIGVPQYAATCAQPVGGWWPASSPSEGLYPPGGFTNYLQSNPFPNHSNGNENFHFVGATMSQSSMSPIDLNATRTPSPAQHSDYVDEQETETINVDEELRTDKRLNWSVGEDKRLASAWLHNSKDPVDGIGRKADKYWADVTEEYNKTIESSRKRNRNQLKIRWDRCKKPLTDFHGCWVNTGRVW
ncbi:uncharacterized protein LOC102709966 isoform X2 [Oryza brachyantha]|uniref:Myb-like domain-containing protein n=1 Tax=Oryza brachyantha TaxID=4533 RepID=J3L0A4_ORYBR|nr:uncharacterized protein LOC102709966 isoform X2 [Oryza brachyantha]